MNAADFPKTGIIHGPVHFNDNSLQWNLWAPQCDSVSLTLFCNGNTTDEIPMKRQDNGMFSHRGANVAEGQRYAFRLGDGPPRPDPASQSQPDGVHLPSAIWDPGRFSWTDDAWTGIPRSDLVIYELHVGTFTDEGTFDAIVPRLDSLRELGVNAIELMPVAQFPGGRDWGYNGVHPFAPQNTYGGPSGLQRLVDACHQKEMSVILDVVYNHFGPEGNYLQEFGPYFTDRYHTPWGRAMNFDQPGCEGVRELILQNVHYWLGNFHIDGLRLDAVQAIYDASPSHILREIKQAATSESRRHKWPVHVIAESDENDVRLLDDPDHDGLGLDAIWNDDFHHSVHALMTGERHSYYVDYGSAEHLAKALNRSFVYDGCHSRFRGRVHGTRADRHPGSRFVVCIQNHDQIGNRAHGDRIATMLNPAQQRQAAGLLLVSPYLPLIFMGEEYGETRPFPFFCSFLDPGLQEAIRQGRMEEHSHQDGHEQGPDPHSELTFCKSRLSWSWPDDSYAAGLRRLYRDLLTIRRNWTVFRDVHNRQADLLPEAHSPKVLRFVRGATSPRASGALVAYFNLTSAPQNIDPSCPHDSQLLLSSEECRYRGGRRPNDPAQLLMPFEFQFYGPRSWKRP